jgi:hypothetical protein
MRQAGRTTRMIKDAIDKTKQGKEVYVLAANTRQLHTLERIACEQIKQHKIKFRTVESIRGFDWQTMSILGVEDSVVFVDHFAIETTFSRVLEMLHRYDEEAKNEE